MAVGDFYRVSWNQTCHGINCVNTFVYKQTGGSGSVAEEQDLAEGFRDDVAANIVGTWGSDQYVSECIVVRKIAPGAASIYHLVHGVEGSFTGVESLPAKSVAVISRYTTQLGRKGRGRTYLSGGLQSWEKDNCWSTAGFSVLINIANWFFADVTSGSGGGVFEPGMLVGTPGSFEEILKHEVRSQIRNLRSRTQKRACG